METPRVSLIVPIYGMDNATEFLKRNLDSILSQTYKDYEIIISDDSDNDMLKIWLKKYPVKYFKNYGPKGMANNTNHAIEQAEGELIKILFQDDYFFDENSLADIVKYFHGSPKWFITGCTHSVAGSLMNEHMPFYSESENTLGSPSVMTIHRSVKERFDPQFHWTLDLDLYKRLFKNYGKPKILNKVNVVIGIGDHQTTAKLSEQRKLLEHEILRKKHE